MVAEKELEKFREWLVANTKFNRAVVSNVLSRVTRANKILTISKDDNLEFYLYMLSKEPGFLACSISVKSQLRRAIKLFYDFKKSQGNMPQ